MTTRAPRSPEAQARGEAFVAKLIKAQKGRGGGFRALLASWAAAERPEGSQPRRRIFSRYPLGDSMVTTYSDGTRRTSRAQARTSRQPPALTVAELTVRMAKHANSTVDGRRRFAVEEMRRTVAKNEMADLIRKGKQLFESMKLHRS
jgi:hypothetical protein